MRPISKGHKALTTVIACILIVCALITGILLYIQYANRPQPEVNKAFIILPGFMESSLTDPEYENTVVWSENPAWLQAQAENNPEFFAEYISSVFSFDEECNPIKQLLPANASLLREDGYTLDQYGFNGITKNLTDFLVAEYADCGYEIVTWQYDWRQSNAQTAQKLEQFIDENDYTNIIFISHGMGGNVVTKYLSKESNRKKVDLFLPVSAPFLGSLDIIDWLFEKSTGLDDSIQRAQTTLMQNLGIFDLVYDVPALAELLPYPAMSQLSVFTEQEVPILLNGETTDYDELYDYFCSRDFARTDTGAVKPVYQNMLTSQRKDFIKIQEKYHHVTEFVDTVYVAGTGIETRHMVDIDTAISKITNISYDNRGDGVVWAYSATAGHALDAQNVIMIDIQEINYNGHDGIMFNNEVLNLIKPVLETHVIRNHSS
ncbi:MAG: hypothetical protein PHI19_02680 [Clostridia bacterium]|nr:hypothetical protein [Clostridia bacterium]